LFFIFVLNFYFFRPRSSTYCAETRKCRTGRDEDQENKVRGEYRPISNGQGGMGQNQTMLRDDDCATFRLLCTPLNSAHGLAEQKTHTRPTMKARAELRPGQGRAGKHKYDGKTRVTRVWVAIFPKLQLRVSTFPFLFLSFLCFFFAFFSCRAYLLY
jgi:hypothetical protein